MLKILICAYTCNPFKGSEPGVGWGWVNTLSRYYDVCVITALHEKEDIENYFCKNRTRFHNIRFFYIHRKRYFNLEKIWPPSYFHSYRSWQKKAYVFAKKLHKSENFNLAHQLTYVGFRVPGYLWQLGIPFVWGPIGGLENTPLKFYPVLGFRGTLYYAARNLINTLQKRFLLEPKKTIQAAKGGIISATSGIKNEIFKWYGAESEVICEIGPPETIADNHSFRNPGETLRLSWSGQHLPGKALPILLKALNQTPEDVRWQLDILGNGPCREKWKKLSNDLNIESRCRWHGQLPRSDAIKVIQRSHIFIITSLKDLTSTVLLEALSQGVPVVTLDHCGFSDVVNAACGIKIPVSNPDQVIRDLNAAVVKLWENENLRRSLAQGALDRIKDFSWENKAAKINSVYENAMHLQT